MKITKHIFTGLFALAFMLVATGMSHAQVVTTAVQAGFINNSTTWDTAVPVSGDTNTWQTGAFTINPTSSDSQTTTFHGQTLVVQGSGALQSSFTTATLQMHNLTLDGGKIVSQVNGPFRISLGNSTFTLNSGELQSHAGNTNRNLVFQNASLAGSGTIAISRVTNPNNMDSFVGFESSVVTSGFTGIFSVTSGRLVLPTISTASFALNLSGTGIFNNSTNVNLTSLTINSTPIAAGTYSYSDFTVAQQAFLLNNGGTITVIPEPSTAGLLGLGAIVGLLARRGRSKV